jgi:hypothetical protein
MSKDNIEQKEILIDLMNMENKENIIDKWLKENGNPEIEKQVENEYKEIMSKLISMTEFVLDYAEVLTVVDNFKDAKHTLNKIFNYANFLSQPLTLGMFVPCDDNNVPLKEPKGWKAFIQENGWKSLHSDALNRCRLYVQAKDKVLFEGFKYLKDDEGYYLEHNNVTLFPEEFGNTTIEHLIQDDLTLTKK